MRQIATRGGPTELELVKETLDGVSIIFAFQHR